MKKNIISLRKIVELNKNMLEKGTPNIKDFTGYNRPDFCTCSKYGKYLLYEEANEICKRLKKYHKTQLKNEILLSELENSEEFYKAISEEIKKNCQNGKILCIIQEGTCYITFSYDKELMNKIKSLGGIWDKEKWSISLKHLKELNRFVIENNYKIDIIETYYTSKDNKIKIEAFDKNGVISVKFNYNETLIDKIKNIPKEERKWDKENKLWNITYLGIEILYQSLDKNIYELNQIENIIKAQ